MICSGSISSDHDTGFVCGKLDTTATSVSPCILTDILGGSAFLGA